MARTSRNQFSWIWVAVVIISGFFTPAYSNAIESRPTLVFRIVNDGRVPQEVVEVAKVQVEHIYAHSGIQVEWSDVDPASQPSNNDGKLNLTMVFVPESVAQIMNRPKGATGFAISNNGEGLRRAYVFVERVDNEAVQMHQKRSEVLEKDAKGLVLAEVIAHEAGHLLLPHDSHSPNGIMQATLGMDSFERARRGTLLFNPEQTKQIRSLLLSRVEAN